MPLLHCVKVNKNEMSCVREEVHAQKPKIGRRNVTQCLSNNDTSIKSPTQVHTTLPQKSPHPTRTITYHAGYCKFLTLFRLLNGACLSSAELNFKSRLLVLHETPVTSTSTSKDLSIQGPRTGVRARDK